MRNVRLVERTALSTRMVRPSNLRDKQLVMHRGAWRWMRLLNVIHVCDRGIGLGVLSETNEAEATAATGVAVLDDDLRLLVKVAWAQYNNTYGFLNLAELLELGAEGAVVSVPGEATVVAR
jgi:hypothetical protein